MTVEVSSNCTWLHSVGKVLLVSNARNWLSQLPGLNFRQHFIHMAAVENSINDGNFPWDMLKADCLRLICIQLGRRSALPARREEMLTFLQDVSKNGCQSHFYDLFS